MIRQFGTLCIMIMFQLGWAQTPVGLIFDLDGIAFDGYFDPPVYVSEGRLQKIYNSEKYISGVYYTLEGEKISGLIQLAEDHLVYRPDILLTPKRIDIKNILSFVVGTDSFYTTSNYVETGPYYGQPIFVRNIAQFGTVEFAEFYDFKISTTGTKVKERYWVRGSSSDPWMLVPKSKKKFRERVPPYFSDFPEIKEQLELGEFDSDDIFHIAKTAEYEFRCKTQEPVYFNQFWKEVDNPVQANYKAFVDCYENGFVLTYYQDETRLYSISFSSVYPHIKHGNLIAFHANGQIRKRIDYVEGEPANVEIFTESGDLLMEYVFQTGPGPDPITKIIHKGLLTPVGYKNLDESANETLEVYDEITDTFYFRTYNDQVELVSSYRMDGEERIYQITNSDFNFNSLGLSSAFDDYMEGKEHLDAVSEDAQGVFLAHIMVSEEGRVVSIKSLNFIHSQINKSAFRFLKEHLVTNHSPSKLKTYKVDGENRMYEFILPVEFVIDRFYKEQEFNFYADPFLYPDLHQINKGLMKNVTPPSIPHVDY